MAGTEIKKGGKNIPGKVLFTKYKAIKKGVSKNSENHVVFLSYENLPFIQDLLESLTIKISQ